MEFKVLAVGDVVGGPGLERIRRSLRWLKRKTNADFVVVNGENAAVVGITPDQADDILDAGADVITMGNHTWSKREIVTYMEDCPQILRPANYAPQTPGEGVCVVDTKAGDVAVLRMGNIQSGRLVFDKLVYTSDQKEIAKYPLEYNDLLFNRTNSKDLVGKVAIYKGEIPAIYAGYLVRLTPVLIDADYLNYVMQSQYYWIYCQNVRSDAIGQSNINAEKLKKFRIPLPPLSEQRRIVNTISQAVAKIERL